MRSLTHFLILLVIMVYGTDTRGNTDGKESKSTMIVAGGCFWCVEADFDQILGVVETISGYTGGHLPNPTYKSVTSGGSGHYEAVKVTFETNQVSYETLLKIFWRTIDPTDANGQFCDRGKSYRTAIFTRTNAQNIAASSSKKQLEKSGKLMASIVTTIKMAEDFFPAEDYHQNFYKKHPLKYKFYRLRCRRDGRIRELWGDEAG